MLRELIVSAILFLVYTVFTGSVSVYDVITGVAVSLILGFTTGRYLVANTEKLLQPRRLLYLVLYFIKYMTVIEARAHYDVVKRVFSMNIRPGIVRIPVNASSRYGRLLVACSITNTPGTVVVAEKDGFFYVNWIYVKSTDPHEARREILEEFDRYAYKIFD